MFGFSASVPFRANCGVCGVRRGGDAEHAVRREWIHFPRNKSGLYRKRKHIFTEA